MSSIRSRRRERGRSRAITFPPSTGVPTDALLALADREIAAKAAEIERLQADLLDQGLRVLELEDELRKRGADIRELKARLEEAYARRELPDGPSCPVVPDSLRDLGAWADGALSGNVVLTPRALRAAKAAVFGDVALVCRALLLLDREYHAMRTGGGPEAFDAFERGLRALGLDNHWTGEVRSLGRVRDAYTIRHGSEKRWLDWHLKNSAGRDPKRCFCLYYTWDEAARQVVVGSLPGHLPLPFR